MNELSIPTLEELFQIIKNEKQILPVKSGIGVSPV